MNRTLLRWTVPAAAAVAVVAAATIPTLASADSADLPEVTPDELVAAIAEAEPVPMSGSAVYTARLGLPEIPTELTGGADPLNLLAGSSTIRTWTDAESRSRISLLGSTSEYSVVTNGPEAWTYASGSNEVTHVTLGPDTQQRLSDAEEEQAAAQSAGTVPTPQQLAQDALERAREHADVAIADATVVAGRDAYQVVITPTDAGTLVDRFVIAVDGETLTPLSVQVWSVEATDAPAVELAYTDVSFTAPSDAALTFSVPSGAEVQEKVLEIGDAQGQHHPDGLPEGVTVTGEGFATIVERTDVDVQGLLAGDPAAVADELDDSPLGGGPGGDLIDELGGHGTDLDAAALYEQLTTPVDGGRLLSSALLSVLITDDGRVLVGAVPGEALLEAAGLA
ncbi:LolA family protein [Pseudactinotalea sp.]|uniref:LolA family protein n=1 Tax=Pseudactinotalea sp. TaxID=1926260 RepID=UPI003B3B0356